VNTPRGIDSKSMANQLVDAKNSS